ncbi:ribonuclease Z [Thermocladium modestius]|uniref:Ribonuclease Z n=1 Tax=Thermocladium modestius TaxID=62609 RepID=A0A830GWS0_9CREN|nr:ribonuclease Z [Thermocladium modestius]GGP21894.1 ribonuclease Z [Thermocladium modestius]
MVTITFLGSGAAIPNRWRALPSILVSHEGYEVLMDAGEGTQSRLQEMGISPLRLTHILLSHLHADHFNGLLGLIATMQLLNRTTPLTIVGPAPIRDWLPELSFLRVIELRESNTEQVVLSSKIEIRYITAYHNVQDNSYSLLIKRPAGKFNPSKANELGVPVKLWRKLHMGESVRVGNRLITPQDVLDSVGNPFLKIVYTGDTAPGENIVKIAQSADVLIHDSTYLDGDVDGEEAHKLGHSTCLDAVRDAVEAGAKSLILTHISYRYGPDYWSAFMKCAIKAFPKSMVAMNGLKLTL